MKKYGKAPVAEMNQWNRDISSYSLHHVVPIQRGGNVYDLENLYVVTPKYHEEILTPSYHKGKKK